MILRNFKQKTFRFLALLCCFFVLFSAIPISVNAASVEETLAKDLYAAVKSKKSKVKIKAQTTDLEGTLEKVFKKYPALFVYYQGYENGLVYSKHTEADFKLKDLDVDWNKIYIAGNSKDLESVFSYCLSRQDEGFRVVMTNGVVPKEEDFAQMALNMKNDHYLSYMGYNGWGGTYYTNENVRLVDYDFHFKYWDGLDRATLAQWRDATEKKTLELAGSLFALDMPDYRKEMLIHDWLVNNNRYNTPNTEAPESHMAYGALVTGKPVCQSYAEAAMLLCKAAGIPAVYVSGTGTNSDGVAGSHGWNCVQIQGEWYNLDVTWDDPTSTDGKDYLKYDYFNITDEKLAKDHQWVRSDAPTCTATAMNYNRVKELVNQDTAYYSDYSNRNVVTRAMTQSQFASKLKLSPIPGGTTPKVSTSKNAATPSATTKQVPLTTTSGTVITDPAVTTTQPVENPTVSSAPVVSVSVAATEGGSLFFPMLGLFLLLFGIGVAWILLLKRSQKPRYRY
jgi:transglutaminase-like putative cysteine protease